MPNPGVSDKVTTQPTPATKAINLPFTKSDQPAQLDLPDFWKDVDFTNNEATEQFLNWMGFGRSSMVELSDADYAIGMEQVLLSFGIENALICTPGGLEIPRI